MFISAFLSPYDELFNIKQNFKMKKYMPLEGLRWSRDSGSTLCDTPQNGRSRTGWGGEIFETFFALWNILVRNFSDFINENPQSVNILYINITKKDSPLFLRENESVDNENTEKTYKGKKVKG